MVHCFREEVELTGVQEMFIPTSLRLAGMWNAVSPPQWIGGKGLGTDTKPSERHDCALFQTAVIKTPLRFVLEYVFVLLSLHTNARPHTYNTWSCKRCVLCSQR